MFDKHEHHHPPAAPASPQKVIHHHPPTVESARYLDELRQQATRDVLSGMLFASDFGPIHVSERPMPTTDGREVTLSYKIKGNLHQQTFVVDNGVRIRIEGGVDGLYRYYLTRIVDALVDAHIGSFRVSGF